MYAFEVLGADAEAALARLLPELEGRVGTIRMGSTDGSTPDGGVTSSLGDTRYVLGDEWRASGDGLSPGDCLDRLAPDHEYAAVVGPADAGLPRVVVGDAPTPDDDSEPLIAAADAAELDVEATVVSISNTEPYETRESLVAAVERSADAEYAGAVATFTGRVRTREDPSDERTRYLEFEKYDGVAERQMATIESELASRDGVLDVRLHHRTGRIDGGDDIVFVVVLAGHREEAFRTVENGIDRLKDEVPLFKKEVTEADSFWVHERDQ